MKAQARLQIVRVSSCCVFWSRKNTVVEITKEVEIPLIPSIGTEISISLTRLDGSATEAEAELVKVKYLFDNSPVINLEFTVNEISLILAALNRGDGDTEKSLDNIVRTFLNSGWTHFE